ncbi:MAG: division/cell wall cluster transcriptional repressor MraZ [Myxococcota bacterium]
MFWGSHDHVLDEKGRTSLPKEFRELLKAFDGHAWLTAFPQCLTIFPPDEFDALQRKLTEASTTIKSIAGLRRLIVGMAAPASFDKQGRILIPPKQRRWAHLDREIVFTGVGRYIEVWDRALHAADLEETRGQHSDLTDILKEFGL